MKIRVGISGCLMSNKARFDGCHEQSKMLSQNLARYFDFVPACPEVGIGMGIPRKPIRRIGDVNSPSIVSAQDNAIDYTEKMVEFSNQKAKEHLDLFGYIFMENSPSVGLFRVKVSQENCCPADESGRGIYASIITQENPQLPIEEASRLTDPSLRENFITRVFAYHKWQQLKQLGFNYHSIIEFHSSYKYSLMAHSPSGYIELGRMLADAGKHEVDVLAAHYFPLLMCALGKVATRKTHANVLMHIQGYLKRVLSSIEKQELSKLINQYRLAQIPLIVPIKRLKHHFNNYPHAYIAKQAYLEPYPDDLSPSNAS